MRVLVQFLASLSGLRIRRCHELWYRVQTQLRSSVALGCGVVQQLSCSSDLTPSLGTSMCLGSDPKNIYIFISYCLCAGKL